MAHQLKMGEPVTGRGSAEMIQLFVGRDGAMKGFPYDPMNAPVLSVNVSHAVAVLRFAALPQKTDRRTARGCCSFVLFLHGFHIHQQFVTRPLQHDSFQYRNRAVL